MSEKRFTVPDRYQFSHSKVQLNGEPLTNDEIVRVLNVNDGAFVENFNLKKENKELQCKLRNCKDARQSYKQDWKACSSYCDEYKSKIISLKDNVEGLIEEKRELKNKLAKVEEILNNRLSDDFRPVWDDGKTELFIEEKVGYWRALKQLKKKLIKENVIVEDLND